MSKCQCIIHHPQTEQERASVREMLDYARRIGDAEAIPIIIAQLAGPCPAWPSRDALD